MPYTTQLPPSLYALTVSIPPLPITPFLPRPECPGPRPQLQTAIGSLYSALDRYRIHGYYPNPWSSQLPSLEQLQPDPRTEYRQGRRASTGQTWDTQTQVWIGTGGAT